MFIHELGRLADGIEQDREGIEPAHESAKLDPSDEVDRDVDVLFADLVQEDVLQGTQDVASVRAKNSGHGKKTADKWNQ